jgi:hypothetical protein
MPKLPGQPPPAERKAAGSSCAPTMPQGRSVLPEGRGAAPRLPGKLRASWAGAAAPPAQPDPRARRDRGSQLSIAPNSRARLRRAERALPHPPLSLIGFHHATELKKKKKKRKMHAQPSASPTETEPTSVRSPSCVRETLQLVLAVLASAATAAVAGSAVPAAAAEIAALGMGRLWAPESWLCGHTLICK